jgi:hypothetical protein
VILRSPHDISRQSDYRFGGTVVFVEWTGEWIDPNRQRDWSARCFERGVAQIRLEDFRRTVTQINLGGQHCKTSRWLARFSQSRRYLIVPDTLPDINLLGQWTGDMLATSTRCR